MILYITIIHVCVCVCGGDIKRQDDLQRFSRSGEGGGGTREAGSDD